MEWIKCSDRLPDLEIDETSYRVLVITNDKRYFEALYDFNHNSWRDWQNFWKLEDVTHWMPLPKQPEKI